MSDSSKTELHPGEPSEYAQNADPQKVRGEAEQWHKVIKDALEPAEKAAIIDPLTGLYTRRFFDQEIVKAIASAERGHSISLIFMDIDHFKKINDQLGHLAGDQALKSLGKLIKEKIRASDSACRFGGEEVVIILPETRLRDDQDQENGAYKLAERLRHSAEASIKAEGRPVTVSIGVTEWHPGDTPSKLVGRADSAMYQAKTVGRNKVIAID